MYMHDAQGAQHPMRVHIYQANPKQGCVIINIYITLCIGLLYEKSKAPLMIVVT